MTVYTPRQRDTIHTLDDPLLIVECAGSGKTQVISQRVVEILRRPHVHPRNVVAFTFTEKAAAELKNCITLIVTEEFGKRSRPGRDVYRHHARVRAGRATDPTWPRRSISHATGALHWRAQ